MALDYQKRVVKEKEELDGRISALEAYLHSEHEGLSEGMRELMEDQLTAMRNYSRTLRRRIRTFTA